MRPDVAPPWERPGVVTRRFGDLTIHALRSGWVRCKEAHRTLSVPAALRLPAILLDPRWTEWMPVTVYAIEHPDGVFLVDAGQTAETSITDRLATDPGTRLFYRHFLDLAFREEERIDQRLRSVGLDVSDVRGVVLTHMHADHGDGLRALPSGLDVHIGAADSRGHQGAIAIAGDRARVRAVEHAGEPFGAMPFSTPLTRDGRVCAVPLPGHSPGHVGVMVSLESHHQAVDVSPQAVNQPAELRGSKNLAMPKRLPSRPPSNVRYALFAGDAAFSLAQVATRTIAGICERPREARTTLEWVRAQLESSSTMLMLSHEPASVDRLADGRAASLEPTDKQRGASA